MGDSASSKGGQVILLQHPIRSSPEMRWTPELCPTSSSSESFSLAQRTISVGFTGPRMAKDSSKAQKQCFQRQLLSVCLPCTNYKLLQVGSQVSEAGVERLFHKARFPCSQRSEHFSWATRTFSCRACLGRHRKNQPFSCCRGGAASVGATQGQSRWQALEQPRSPARHPRCHWHSCCGRQLACSAASGIPAFTPARLHPQQHKPGRCLCPQKRCRVKAQFER